MTTPEPADDLALPGRGVVTRWSLRLAAAVMLVGGVVLIFLLVQATNNRLLYERYFARLLWVNIAVVIHESYLKVFFIEAFLLAKCAQYGTPPAHCGNASLAHGPWSRCAAHPD